MSGRPTLVVNRVRHQMWSEQHDPPTEQIETAHAAPA
jgi:hypothetical protein